VAAIRVSELERSHRVDSDYYRPVYLAYDARIASLNPKLLSTLAQISDGNHIAIEDQFTDSGVRYLRGQDLADFFISDANSVFIPDEVYRSLTRSHMKPGDVLLSIVGTIGRVALVTNRYQALTGSCKIAIIRPHSVNPCFLAIYLSSTPGQEQIARRVRGAVQQGLILPDLKAIPVPSVDEQLAKKVEGLVKRSRQQQEKSESLYAQAQALLTAELGLDRLDLSEGRCSVRRASEVQGSGRADAEYYKRKYLNLLSCLEGMPHVILEEIATFSGGATPLGAEYLDEGIPFLRIQNVGENRLVMDDVAYIDDAIHAGLLKRSQLAPRDVLITITGRIGTAAVVPQDLKQANINQHIVRMRLKSKEINPYYLAAFLNSVGGRLQTEREAYGTTRDALPYYCLARVRIVKADVSLQNEIEQIVRKAGEASQGAKRLLAEARAEVERMIEAA